MPDFVFEKDYKLKPLEEVESFIKSNKHLPGISSAEEAKEKGIDLGNSQTALLQKVEELSLYLISEKKDLENAAEEIEKYNNTRISQNN